eukprot:2287770-Pyramimonas_sp.AAC.3
MFIISTISDSHVRILPENLAKSRLEAVSDAIEQIYIDKVRKRATHSRWISGVQIPQIPYGLCEHACAKSAIFTT